MNAEEIRSIVRQEIVDAIRSGRIRKRPKDRRTVVNVRLFPEELDAFDAVAASRGLTRSALVRECLATVLTVGMRDRKEIPSGLRHASNQRKARHHRSPDSDDRAREEAGRKAVHHALESRRLMREADAAPTPAVVPGMLSDAAGRRSVPKLSR